MTGQLAEALEFAAEVHRDQTDRAGVPTIVHVCCVVNGCKRPESRIVAALHDCVEDSDDPAETLKHIEQRFGYFIAERVKLVTRGDDEPYIEYIRRIKRSGSQIAREVKIADLRHNSQLSRIRKPTDSDFKRIAKYARALSMLGASQ